MPEIHNHLPHPINILPGRFFSDMPERRWNAAERVPRASEETVRVLGVVGLAYSEIPVLQRRFTHLIGDEAMPYNPHILSIVSHETIAAARRSGRPIDDLAYPMGIVRDETGRVIGCRGFGMPQPVYPVYRPQLALAPPEIKHLGDPSEWVNTANYPMRLYDPDVVPHDTDMIDGDLHSPLLDMPPAVAPADVSPHVVLDEPRTEQFGAPIFKVWPNRGEHGVKNLPDDPNRLHLLHPIALRHAALLGRSLHFCVTLGGLVRDQRYGTVLGGTSIYVFDPDMLKQDGM